MAIFIPYLMMQNPVRTMLDQIDFMAGLLQLYNLSTRIDRYLQFEALNLETKARDRLSRLLKAACSVEKIHSFSSPLPPESVG